MGRMLIVKTQRAVKGMLGLKDRARGAPPALLGEVWLWPLTAEACFGLPRAELNHSRRKMKRAGTRKSHLAETKTAALIGCLAAGSFRCLLT